MSDKNITKKSNSGESYKTPSTNCTSNDIKNQPSSSLYGTDSNLQSTVPKKNDISTIDKKSFTLSDGDGPNSDALLILMSNISIDDSNNNNNSINKINNSTNENLSNKLSDDNSSEYDILSVQIKEMSIKPKNKEILQNTTRNIMDTPNLCFNVGTKRTTTPKRSNIPKNDKNKNKNNLLESFMDNRNSNSDQTINEIISNFDGLKLTNISTLENKHITINNNNTNNDYNNNNNINNNNNNNPIENNNIYKCNELLQSLKNKYKSEVFKSKNIDDFKQDTDELSKYYEIVNEEMKKEIIQLYCDYLTPAKTDTKLIGSKNYDGKTITGICSPKGKKIHSNPGGSCNCACLEQWVYTTEDMDKCNHCYKTKLKNQ